MTEGAGEHASLRAVLSMVEKHGCVVLPARSVEGLASPDARAALHVVGAIGSAPAAATWPCDVRGCSREVRANYDGARKPLVAVCCQAPAACAPVELTFEDVAHQELHVDALVGAACALLGASVDRAALAKVRDRRAVGESRAPVLVATIDDPPCDVFWAGCPRDMDLAAFCARRERVTRGTLVLVPTAEHVPVEVAARFAPGEQVEIRALADSIVVSGGALALRDRGQGHVAKLAPSPAPPVPATPSASAHGIAAMLGVTSWEQVRLSIVDGHTLRVEAQGKTVLRTFVELGFVDGRKTDVVTPVRAWATLFLFCKKGIVRPSEYAAIGRAYGAKKSIETIGKAMRQAFGLEEHPIRKYDRRRGQWVARFRVVAE